MSERNILGRITNHDRWVLRPFQDTRFIPFGLDPHDPSKYRTIDRKYTEYPFGLKEGVYFIDWDTRKAVPDGFRENWFPVNFRTTPVHFQVDRQLSTFTRNINRRVGYDSDIIQPVRMLRRLRRYQTFTNRNHSLFRETPAKPDLPSNPPEFFYLKTWQGSITGQTWDEEEEEWISVTYDYSGHVRFAMEVESENRARPIITEDTSQYAVTGGINDGQTVTPYNTPFLPLVSTPPADGNDDDTPLWETTISGDRKTGTLEAPSGSANSSGSVTVQLSEPFAFQDVIDFLNDDVVEDWTNEISPDDRAANSRDHWNYYRWNDHHGEVGLHLVNEFFINKLRIYIDLSDLGDIGPFNIEYDVVERELQPRVAGVGGHSGDGSTSVDHDIRMELFDPVTNNDVQDDFGVIVDDPADPSWNQRGYGYQHPFVPTEYTGGHLSYGGGRIRPRGARQLSMKYKLGVFGFNHPYTVSWDEIMLDSDHTNAEVKSIASFSEQTTSTGQWHETGMHFAHLPYETTDPDDVLHLMNVVVTDKDGNDIGRAPGPSTINREGSGEGWFFLQHERRGRNMNRFFKGLIDEDAEYKRRVIKTEENYVPSTLDCKQDDAYQNIQSCPKDTLSIYEDEDVWTPDGVVTNVLTNQSTFQGQVLTYDVPWRHSHVRTKPSIINMSYEFPDSIDPQSDTLYTHSYQDYFFDAIRYRMILTGKHTIEAPEISRTTHYTTTSDDPQYGQITPEITLPTPELENRVYAIERITVVASGS